MQSVGNYHDNICLKESKICKEMSKSEFLRYKKMHSEHVFQELISQMIKGITQVVSEQPS